MLMVILSNAPIAASETELPATDQVTLGESGHFNLTETGHFNLAATPYCRGWVQMSGWAPNRNVAVGAKSRVVEC
jgi:hypothetical protein